MWPRHPPQFTHDCPSCIFFGRYNGHDLYFCPPTRDGGGTVLARFGNEAGEYSSSTIEHALASECATPRLPDDPGVATRHLARKLLSEGFVTCQVTRLALVEHKLRLDNADTWDVIYAAFLAHFGAAPDAARAAARFCHDECMGFLVPASDSQR